MIKEFIIYGKMHFWPHTHEPILSSNSRQGIKDWTNPKAYLNKMIHFSDRTSPVNYTKCRTRQKNKTKHNRRQKRERRKLNLILKGKMVLNLFSKPWRKSIMLLCRLVEWFQCKIVVGWSWLDTRWPPKPLYDFLSSAGQGRENLRKGLR